MTPDTFQSFLTTGVFAFILVFVRIGTAIMIMPGIGNAFVPANIRLYFALAFTFVVFPVLQSKVPNPIPETFTLFTMIIMEFVAGLLLGTVMRILLGAIDIAGMIIATQSSLANAQLFNPAFASQGTVIGSFLTMVATLLLLVTDMHHLMITGIIESYDLILINQLPSMGDIANILIQEITLSFRIAIQMTAPFLIIVTILNVGMGVMSKLMPQVQVFMLAVPVQITLSLITLMIIMSTMMLFWLTKFDEGFQFFYGLITR
jgi:flagellar biosynthetic protein FliR